MPCREMKVPITVDQYFKLKMEENSSNNSSNLTSSQNHNGAGSGMPFNMYLGPNMSGTGANNKQQQQQQQQQGNNSGGLLGGMGSELDGMGGGVGQGGNVMNKDQSPQYTMPGILHYLQHEWARFELERSQWELDRAEYQARIAFLQGERKGQENLKTDLVRRIKMLEYALKQERAKFHKLKYGTDLVIPGDTNVKPEGYEENSTCTGTEGVGGDGEAPFTSISNLNWKQGRQLLRQYLQEIGYTDTIIDVRSNRVRSLLGLNNNSESDNINNQGLNGNESIKRGDKDPGKAKNSEKLGMMKSYKSPSPRKQQPSSMAEAMMLDTEAAVMATFEFLGNTDIDMDEDDGENEEDMYDSGADAKQNKTSILLGEDVDAEAEEVLSELNLLSEHEESIIHVELDSHDWRRQPDPRLSKESGSALGLGELAQLTVNNDVEAAYDMGTNNEESFRKSWNAKYTLRSHFDGIRALVFHPTDPVLITASDDHTLKLWNLHKTVPAKKSASLDVEPLYTFRSHTGPVLCLAMDNVGNHCYSGGVDSKIFCWTLPSANIDPYDSYDPSLLTQTLLGHTDAVWGLSMCHTRNQLLSVSADGTVKLWSPHSKVPLLNSYASEEHANPTSVDFIRDEPNKIAVAYEKACVVYDTETGAALSTLEGTDMQGINRLVAHPILPLVVTANEDHHIRFYDHRSATIAHSMVAHLDAVTSLAVDPNGLYLLSGSHDCSIRLWNMNNKTCVQEITAHRKKFDESILDVAFHPTRPFIASAGADALAKVFV